MAYVYINLKLGPADKNNRVNPNKDVILSIFISMRYDKIQRHWWHGATGST